VNKVSGAVDGIYDPRRIVCENTVLTFLHRLFTNKTSSGGGPNRNTKIIIKLIIIIDTVHLYAVLIIIMRTIDIVPREIQSKLGGARQAHRQTLEAYLGHFLFKKN